MTSKENGIRIGIPPRQSGRRGITFRREDFAWKFWIRRSIDGTAGMSLVVGMIVVARRSRIARGVMVASRQRDIRQTSPC